MLKEGSRETDDWLEHVTEDRRKKKAGAFRRVAEVPMLRCGAVK